MFDNGHPGNLGPVVRFCFDGAFYWQGVVCLAVELGVRDGIRNWLVTAA
jgi:hypothetical protein